MPTNLTPLPAELLHQTCHDLANPHSWRALRLTSRALEAIAAAHALRTLRIRLRHADFLMLRYYATHRVLAANVRRLVNVHVDVDKVLGGGPWWRLSYSDFLVEIQTDDALRDFVRRSAAELPPLRFSRPETSWRWYFQWLGAWEEHERLLRWGLDLDGFREALAWRTSWVPWVREE